MVPSSDVKSIIARAKQEKDSSRALKLYQQALEQLQLAISRLSPGTEQDQLIQQFKSVLVQAETLKQPESQGGQYEQLKLQAKTLAEQAVAADGRGELAKAYQQYCQLMEVLNKCHWMETAPAVRTAIMARFQVYLERAEVIRKVQQQSRTAAAGSKTAADGS